MKPETLTALLSHVTSECNAIDREERFDAMLDECYSFNSVGGPFACMSPSSVLKEYDPTAYSCEVNDWADGEGWVEIDGSYYDSDEVDKARGELVSEMESEASDLDTEQEESETEGDLIEAGIAAAKAEALRADIAEVERYTF